MSPEVKGKGKGNGKGTLDIGKEKSFSRDSSTGRHPELGEAMMHQSLHIHNKYTCLHTHIHRFTLTHKPALCLLRLCLFSLLHMHTHIRTWALCSRCAWAANNTRTHTRMRSAYCAVVVRLRLGSLLHMHTYTRFTAAAFGQQPIQAHTRSA